MDRKRLLNELRGLKLHDFAKFCFSRYTHTMSLVSCKSVAKSKHEPHSVTTPMRVPVFIAQTNVLFIFCIMPKGSCNSMNSRS